MFCDIEIRESLGNSVSVFVNVQRVGCPSCDVLTTITVVSGRGAKDVRVFVKGQTVVIPSTVAVNGMVMITVSSMSDGLLVVDRVIGSGPVTPQYSIY